MTKGFLGAGLALIALGLGFQATGAAAAEHRCGWYENPTPSNFFLVDRDGTWWIQSQGEAEGPDAQGVEDNSPDFGKDFVQTSSAGYGYGCACLTVETDAKHHRVLKLIASKVLPVAQCKRDKSLPAPDQ